MFGIHESIGIFAGIIGFLSFFSYTYSILKGKTRPHRLSWWTWTALSVVIWISYYEGGARTTLWVPLSETIGPFIVAILSIKYGQKEWGILDVRCLLGILITLLLWWIFNSPFIALVCALCVDLIAAIPTIKKSFFDPAGEDRLAWILFTVANFLNIFAAEKFDLKILIHPIYFCIIGFLILAPSFLKKKGL